MQDRMRRAAKELNAKGEELFKEKKKREARRFYAQAVKELKKIKKKTRTDEDWRYLSEYRWNAGCTAKDFRRSYSWYKKAVESCSQIHDRTDNDWRNLSKYQNSAGFACSNLA